MQPQSTSVPTTLLQTPASWPQNQAQSLADLHQALAVSQNAFAQNVLPQSENKIGGPSGQLLNQMPQQLQTQHAEAKPMFFQSQAALNQYLQSSQPKTLPQPQQLQLPAFKLKPDVVNSNTTQHQPQQSTAGAQIQMPTPQTHNYQIKTPQPIKPIAQVPSTSSNAFNPFGVGAQAQMGKHDLVSQFAIQQQMGNQDVLNQQNQQFIQPNNNVQSSYNGIMVPQPLHHHPTLNQSIVIQHQQPQPATVYYAHPQQTVQATNTAQHQLIQLPFSNQTASAQQNQQQAQAQTYPRIATTSQVIQATNQFGQQIEYRIIATPAQAENLMQGVQQQQNFQQVLAKDNTEQVAGQHQVFLGNLVGGQVQHTAQQQPIDKHQVNHIMTSQGLMVQQTQQGQKSMNLLKKQRQRLSTSQIAYLEHEFKKNPYWNKAIQQQICSRLGLSVAKIYKWNWDRRKKEEQENKLFDPNTTPLIDIVTNETGLGQQQPASSNINAMRNTTQPSDALNMKTFSENNQLPQVNQIAQSF